MPSTYVSLHVHLVFSTKNRQPFLDNRFREPLFAVLCGTARGCGAIPLEVGGMPDHVHMLVGLKATHRIANLVRDVKVETSRWMHDHALLRAFEWQDGYGAFSVSASGLDSVREYIRNQETHHATRTYEDEFVALLKKHRIEFDPRYLF